MAPSSKERRPTISGSRFSASAEASREAERERLARMSPLERVDLALGLGRRRQALLQRAKESESGKEPSGSLIGR